MREALGMLRQSMRGGDIAGDIARVMPADAAAVLPRLTRREIDMRTRGITPQQRQGYRPGISEMLNTLIAPFADPETLLNLNPIQMIGSLKGDAERRVHRPDPGSEDAWRLYLGMPQQYGSLEVSKFQPSQSSDRNVEYFSLKGAWPTLLSGQERYARLRGTNELGALIQQVDEAGGRLVLNGDLFGLQSLRNFTVTKGEDENGHYISYYDRFDLEQPLEGVVGKPFEIYDRMYYDPETLTPIDQPRRRVSANNQSGRR